MCFSAPSVPAAPPPPAIPPVPELPDQGVSAASTEPKNLAIAAMSNNGTVLTGPQGLTAAPQTSAKNLLGS